MLRLILFVCGLLVVCGLIISVGESAHAIAPIVVHHSGYQIWDDDGTQWQMLYVGTNTAGNNVVLIAHNTASDSVLKTYEIAHSGTIVGLIDTGTYNDRGMGGSGNPINSIHLMDNNWLVIACGGANPVYRSVHITSEGGISNIGDTIDGGSDIVVESVRVSGTDILALDTVVGAIRYISIDTGDGSLTLNDTYNFTAPDPVAARDMCYIDDWSNGPIRAFAVFDSRPPTTSQWLMIGTFNYTNKTLCNSWVGTNTATYIGDVKNSATTNVGQTISVGSINTGDYVTMWRVGTPTGHGGDADIGVEWWDLTNIYNVHTVGTLTLNDTPGANDAGLCAYNISDHNLMFGYEAGGNKLRSIYNLSEPPLSTGQLSDEFALPIGWKQGLILQDDLLFLSIYESAGASYLSTYIIQVPPTVTTDDLVERGHDEGDMPPILSADGSVLSVGDSNVTEWGFVYNQIGYPTYSGSKITTTGTHSAPFSFSGTITEDLRFDDVHYVRAYACNSSGTGYGQQLNTYTHPIYSHLILYLDFEPDQISSGTISDQSGYGHDVSYVLAVNPVGLDTTIGDIVPTDLAEYTCVGTECEHIFDAQFVAPPGYVIEPGSSNVPSVDWLPDNTVSARLFWLSGMTILFCVFGFLVYRYTRVLLVTAVIGLLCIFWACYQGWMGWWVFVMCVILTPGLLLKDESRQPF